MQERKLTARSVLASTLLGAEPPELPVSHLVHVAGLFGINENRARVALSRMVSSGEATTNGAGDYRLAGHLLQRQVRQTASRAGRTGRWSGDWHIVVLSAAGRAAEVRGQRRAALVRARLAELRLGVWLRPDNLALELPAEVSPDDAVIFRGRPASGRLASGDFASGDTVFGDTASDDRALAASLWDLDGWAARARAFLGELEANPPVGPDVLAPGFVLSASVLRHFQADPLLPSALLPAAWPGERLRRVYDEWDRAYRRVLVEWSRSI